ncbi:MAG: hypothetical protein ACRDGT_01880 [Candidatus Limnocylindria bacterium]
MVQLRGFAAASGLVIVVIGGILLGARWWNDPAAATKDDEHYIAIARSIPEVFRHPDADGTVQATVERSGRLAVEFRFPSERVLVFIHPRTEEIEGILFDPPRR